MSDERVVYHDGFLPPSEGTGDFEESLTRQSEAKDADINNIIDRFVRTGIMPVDDREALYLDVSEVGDYRKVREQIRLADEYFMTLDAKVRAEFNNDPAEFLDEFVDPASKQKFIDLGILPKEEVSDGVPKAGETSAPPVAVAGTKGPAGL